MNLSRLFTVQLSMFFVVFSNSDMLSYLQVFVNNFFIFLFQFFRTERRRRDLNPRAAVNDLHPFQGCPFGQLGYFSELFIIIHLPPMYQTQLYFGERRGWDSNPCALADKRFSRPPRYDHFDTSPCFALESVQKLFYHPHCLLSTTFCIFFHFSCECLKYASATIKSSGVVILIFR